MSVTNLESSAVHARGRVDSTKSIRFADVVKRFDGVTAVRNLNLELLDGELLVRRAALEGNEPVAEQKIAAAAGG